VAVCPSEQIVIPIHHKGMPRVYPNRNEWVADGAGGLRFDNAIRHPLPCAGETVSVRFGAPIDVWPSFIAPRAGGRTGGRRARLLGAGPGPRGCARIRARPAVEGAEGAGPEADALAAPARARRGGGGGLGG